MTASRHKNDALLDKVIEIIDRVYPDGLIEQYHQNPRGNHGDTLAQFIVQEVGDLVMGCDGEAEALSEAIRGLGLAREQLTTVVIALETALERLEEGQK